MVKQAELDKLEKDDLKSKLRVNSPGKSNQD